MITPQRYHVLVGGVLSKHTAARWTLNRRTRVCNLILSSPRMPTDQCSYSWFQESCRGLDPSPYTEARPLVAVSLALRVCCTELFLGPFDYHHHREITGRKPARAHISLHYFILFLAQHPSQKELGNRLNSTALLNSVWLLCVSVITVKLLQLFLKHLYRIVNYRKQ